MMVIMLAGAALLASCTADEPGAIGQSSGAASTTSPAGNPSPTPDSPAIVGEWHRLQTCSELEQAMTSAGLDQALLEAIAGDGWIPGVTSVDQIADPVDPCRGAIAREHSHFFTADGRFGSRDATGQQVDDGRYELIGNDTVVISDVTFHYLITGGDTIAFSPVIPDCAPACFEAGWSVAVAYPGYNWERVG